MERLNWQDKLKIKCNDNNQTLIELARELGVQSSTVLYWQKKLDARRHIPAYTTVGAGTYEKAVDVLPITMIAKVLGTTAPTLRKHLKSIGVLN